MNAHRTDDGNASITTEYHRRTTRSYSSLAAQLVDPDLAAERLTDELGPAACRRLGEALLDLVSEVQR